jgi:hypothetical protein
MLPALVFAIVAVPRIAPVGLEARSALASEPCAGDAQAFPELNLSFDLSAFESLAPEKTSALPSCKGEWTGKVGASGAHIWLEVEDATKSVFLEPEDVVVWRRGQMRGKETSAGNEYDFEAVRSVPGAFGAAPFLATTRASAHSTAQPNEKSTCFMLAGLVPDKAWTLLVQVAPPLEAERANALQGALEKCVKYDGKPRDPKWTDAEAQAFWQRFAPESTHAKYGKPVRTEHYIVLNDFPSAREFGKKLEAHYAAAKKVLPFEEQKSRRLLPVLCFQTDDEFQLFITNRKKLDPKTQGTDSGAAAGIWYATSFDNDDEEDQLVDVSTQLMINRARCWTGTSWFCNGLRYYIGFKPASLVETKGLVKKNRATPLEKLLDDSKWGAKPDRKHKAAPTDDPDFWEQSALWMEFLHDAPAVKAKFPQLVQAMALIPDGDGEKTGATLESIYGMRLPVLQSKWVEFLSKK